MWGLLITAFCTVSLRLNSKGNKMSAGMGHQPCERTPLFSVENTLEIGT